MTHQNIKLPEILNDIPESNKIYGTIDIDVNNVLYAYISESQIDNVTNNSLEKKEQIINFIKNYYDVDTKLY